MTERPLILITNDDGVSSRGIAALAEVAAERADVIVVAPDGAYSGKSHSITVMDELRTRRAECGGVSECYAVKGTPVDCVKLGYYGLAKRRPTLLLSGINHGSNTSVSVHYSGTAGAAREGALLGVTSCAISLADYSPEADMEAAKRVAGAIIDKLLDPSVRLKAGLMLNVNIPAGEVKGIRCAAMAMGRWVETPYHHTTVFGEELYWLDGKFEEIASGDTMTDEKLIQRGYAALTPILVDVTDRGAMEECKIFEQ